MLLNCLLNLHPPHLILQAPQRLAKAHHLPILKTDEGVIGFTADFGHAEAVLVVRPFVGEGIQVVALFQADGFLLGAVLGLHMQAHFGLDALFGDGLDAFDAQERVLAPVVGRYTGHDDLFDQFKLERPHRVEAVDEVVGVAMGGGVAQGAKRVERTNRLLCFVGAVHALWLINEDDGASGLDELDGLPPRAIAPVCR